MQESGSACLITACLTVFLLCGCTTISEQPLENMQTETTTSVVYNTNYATASYKYSILYDTLSVQEQTVYREIYSGLKARSTSITITAILKPEDFERVYKIVSVQEGEFYDLAGTMEYSVLKRTGCVNALYVTYTKDEQARHIADICIDSGVACLADEIGRITDKRVIVRKIHNYLVTSVTYDEDAQEADNIYGVFVDGRATCSGYAKAFKFLCEKYDIPCIVATGTANGNHMWNYVKIKDCWYGVDVTWDDPDAEDDLLIYNDYCIVDTVKIAETHTLDKVYSDFLS